MSAGGGGTLQGTAAHGFSEPRARQATIYHNPACGTSRNTLAMLRQAGVETTVVHYLETPPDAECLRELLTLTGLSARELLRRKGTPHDALGLDDPTLDERTLVEAMLAHPILINRPIVVTELGARLCRPSETVLELIDPTALGRFVKEDGEVIDARTGPRAPRPTAPTDQPPSTTP